MNPTSSTWSFHEPIVMSAPADGPDAFLRTPAARVAPIAATVMPYRISRYEIFEKAL
jgi:hypothetical protein